MIWWSQLIAFLVAAAVFMLLLRSNRRQDAMEESFIETILLCLGSFFVPDLILLLPCVWSAFRILWCGNLRVYLASVLGLMTVALYSAIVWLLWPNGIVCTYVIGQWADALHRVLCYPAPLWFLISAGSLALIGLGSLIAHLSKYTRANVRIQTRVLILIAPLLLSVLSCVFPTASGNCLHCVLALIALYLLILHLVTYGVPRPHMPQIKEHRSKMNRRMDTYNHMHRVRPFRRSRDTYRRHSRLWEFFHHRRNPYA